MIIIYYNLFFIKATSIVKAELVDSIFSFTSSLIRKIETICEPDQTVLDDCNECTCSQSGKSKICTEKVCVTNTTNNGSRFRFGYPNCEYHSVFLSQPPMKLPLGKFSIER